MKKMYNLFFNLMPCLFVMTMLATVASAQCPVGQTKVDVTYTTGGFNGENSWVLYDVTQGVDLLCQTSNPPAGTQSVCVTDNNVIELQGFESFGDGWCPPANIVVAINENATVNGCANPSGSSPGSVIVLYDGDTGASGNGVYTCNNAGGGTVAVQFSTFCPSCEYTCPSDITVGTDDGVCEATVTIPDPVLDDNPDCELLGAPGNFVTRNGTPVPYNYAPNLVDTPFSVSGVTPIAANAPCVTEVCIDFNATGDHSFNTEDSPIFLEGTMIGNVPFGGLDCVDRPFQLCIPIAQYDAAAADGTLNFVLGADPDVNNFCTVATVVANVTYPTACVGFLNSFTQAENGPAVYPLGTTCVNITGTGSGFGTAFPINCEVKVTVVDDEAPVLDCPGDFTFNLQGGECEQIYDFEVIVTDNCPAGGGELPGSVFGSIGNCPGQGSTLACGVGLIGQVQEMDISGFPQNAPVRIDEGCFIFDNTAWGNTMATVNFYVEPAGFTASNTPLPCFTTGTPVATSGLVDVTMFANAPGEEACIPVFDVNTGLEFVLAPGAPGLYMEVVNAGAGGHLAFNGPSCNGITSTGDNTFFWTVSCVPGSGFYNDIGFAGIDAFFSYTGAVITPPLPMEPGLNEYASGDALPIGEHCFLARATDFAGNTSECEWCVTVNEFPEDQIVTSLACNDLVNVSLSQDCSAFISADMFLEGGPYGCYFNCYEVFISGVAGDVNGETIELAPGMYTVTVNDACRDNSCWGEMLVEDKLGPAMPPIEDINITCKDEIPNLLSAGKEFPAVVPIDDIVGEGITSNEPEQFLSFDVVSECEITDLNVAVNITHTWMGDVQLDIISPSGTRVSLVSNQCGNTDNANVVFDDEGAPFACGLYSPGTGAAVRPAQPLSNLDGEPMGGTWMFRWDDTVGGDDGVFNNVTLTFNDGEVFCGATVTPEDYLSSVGSSCEVVDLEIGQTEVIGNSCEGITTLRTWIATDASGNSSTKVQTITQERVGVADLNEEWFWPAGNVELTCGADASPDAIYNYFRARWEAQFPCPLPTCDETDGHNYDPDFVALWECNANAAGVQWAYPLCFNDKGLQESFLVNSCNVFFTYSDQVLPACGPGCYGNNKIIRTWTALDWCTGATENAVQVISAKDTEGPTSSPLAPMTVSASPWGCAANFTLPVPDHLYDNCSNVVTYRIYGQPGTITEIVAGPRILLDEDDNPVLDANGYPVWIVEGLPKAMTPYTYTYELRDCCGNVSYTTLQVTVVDGSAPVAIAKQNIVISLTSSPTDPQGGSAKLYVQSVDNGSHDGDCGPVRVAIRRTDEGVCGSFGVNGHENNTTFFNFNNLPNAQQPTDHDRDDTDEGLFVKFCCQDLIDGNGADTDGDGINDYVLIDVELGVWDDANMDGIPGTPGDLFGITWATVRVEAKLAPTLTCPPLAKITCDMDEKNLAVTGGSAYASSTCGNLDVEYFDLCGLDINQDGEISEFTVTNQNGMLINEVAMCTDVNRDGRIANYTAPWWSTVDEDLFNKACHYGPITRWWSISGTNVQCRQIIVVEEPVDLQRFDGSVSIDWPYSEDEFIRLADNDGDDCGLMEVAGADIVQVDTNDDDIPDYAEVKLSCIDGLCDRPYWVDATCSLIGWSLDTDTFYFEGDACRKIINTYTVIDWCQYNPNNPSLGGIWSWTVIGKLIDTYAPVVEAGDDMFEAVPGSGGSGTSIDERACVGVGIQMSAVAFDTNIDEDGDVIENACPSEWLKWNVYVDINNDWVFDREWSSFVPEDRNTSTDPLWSEDNAADNLFVYGYLIPDVRVGNRGGVDNNEGDFATPPGFEYTINIPDAIPADCGETKHRVEWKVYDGCGNVSSTTSYFTVQDKKAPTPYCINLSTALMADPDGSGPEESMVELWAIDFDYGSFDNCVAYEYLRFTFTETAPELDPAYNEALRSSARRFTCEDLEGTNDATLTIPIYVWDLCGNYDFCQVNLRLVDNNPNGCTDSTGTGSIAGHVETEFGQSIENVEVNNENMFYEFEDSDMTDRDGNYLFVNNFLTMDYQVRATKNDDYMNGVSTLDLVLIQRHILGLENLDSAYKLIAADVNNDGAVTAIDLIELRKLILGIYEELPSNSSWRFVDAAQTLDINSPWNFDETIDIYNLSADMINENFVGIKVGDVNESVVANATTGTTEDRSSATVNVEFEDMQVEAGQTFDLTVTADGINNIYGYQFTLGTKGLELITVNSGAINVSEDNFGVHGNAITTSWNTDKAVTANGPLFTMTFKATTSGLVSDLVKMNSEITRAEAYVGANLDIVNISLNNNSTASNVEFALYQNEPNPFTTNTVVGFELPQAADATFTVLDVTGKVVMSINNNFAKGYNEIELSKSDLGAAGVYYYQLESGDFTATKKMIIIE